MATFSFFKTLLDRLFGPGAKPQPRRREPARKSKRFDYDFYAKERGLADYLPYQLPMDTGRGVALALNTKALQANFEFVGDDAQNLSPAEMESVSQDVADALLRLGKHWMFNINLGRVRSDSYPESEHLTTVGAFLDCRKRAIHENEGDHRESRTFLSVTYHYADDTAARNISKVVRRNTAAGKSSTSGKFLDDALQVFETKLEAFVSAFNANGRIRLRRLGADATVGFLKGCVHGEFKSYHEVPEYFGLSSYLGEETLNTSPLKVGRKFVQVITIDDYASVTEPFILGALTSLPCDYRLSFRAVAWSNRDFDAISTRMARNFDDESLRLMQKIQKERGQNYGTPDQLKLALKAEAEHARSMVNDNKMRAFTLSVQVLLYDHDLKHLEETTARLVKEIEESKGGGWLARVEDIQAFDTFLGTMPGERVRGLRNSFVLSHNIADMLPLHTVWSGPVKHPDKRFGEDAPPLMYAQTDGGTPFRLFLHKDDAGDFAVLGPPGAGKSTLLCAIVNNHFRYPGAQAFVFDKGYSMLPLVRSFGSKGAHLDLGGPESEAGQVGFCPFAHIHESDKELDWAVEWVCTLCELNNLEPSLEQQQKVRQALKALATDSDRRLMKLAMLMQDPDVRMVLQKYVQGSSVAGNILDADYDTMATTDFVVFEMGNLLEAGEEYAVPVMLYLWHALEKRWNFADNQASRKTMLVIDEAHFMLRHKPSREKVKDLMYTGRKHQLQIGLASQYLEQLEEAGLVDLFSQGISTFLFCANEAAARPEVGALYTRLANLNERQRMLVSRMRRKKHYLVVHPEGRRVVEFGFTDLELAFYGKASPDDLKVCRRLWREHGELWVEPWLRDHNGLPDAARIWRQRHERNVLTNT